MPVLRRPAIIEQSIIEQSFIVAQQLSNLAIVSVHAPPRETTNKTASAITNRTITCETIIQDASASIHQSSMSSPRERIEMVALHPQHISPCATQLQDASAREPMPNPRQSKSKNMPKNMTGSRNQWKNVPENMAISRAANTLGNAPTPLQNHNKTSAVFNNNDTTSAPMGFNPLGFNHLPQVKGEKVVGPVQYPSTQATTNFSYSSFLTNNWLNFQIRFLLKNEKNFHFLIIRCGFKFGGFGQWNLHNGILAKLFSKSSNLNTEI